jgi:WD40 repeat protein
VRDLCFLDSRLVSVSDDKSMKLWSLELGVCELTLSSVHAQFVNCVRVDKGVIGTCSVDMAIRLWK